MKKKFMYILSLVTVIVIATFVGRNILVPSAFKANNLLMQNVEALSGSEGVVLYPECIAYCDYENVSYTEGKRTET